MDGWWHRPLYELCQNCQKSTIQFFFSSSFFCPNTCTVRFALLQYDYYARSSSKWEEERERANDIGRKGKKQNRVQLTGQILEPMKQVCMYVHEFFRFLSVSLFPLLSFYFMHTHERCLSFLFYSTPREQCV
jgi:hypothetical protein